MSALRKLTTWLIPALCLLFIASSVFTAMRSSTEGA